MIEKVRSIAMVGVPLGELRVRGKSAQRRGGL